MPKLILGWLIDWFLSLFPPPTPPLDDEEPLDDPKDYH